MKNQELITATTATKFNWTKLTEACFSREIICLCVINFMKLAQTYSKCIPIHSFDVLFEFWLCIVRTCGHTALSQPHSIFTNDRNKCPAIIYAQSVWIQYSGVAHKLNAIKIYYNETKVWTFIRNSLESKIITIITIQKKVSLFLWSSICVHLKCCSKFHSSSDSKKSTSWYS